jgi:hypothetical protein
MYNWHMLMLQLLHILQAWASSDTIRNVQNGVRRRETRDFLRTIATLTDIGVRRGREVRVM